MRISRIVRFTAFALCAFAPFQAWAGWNYGSRKNCKIFAKYRVEVHALYTAQGGGSGVIRRDTGCTYAHAGPVAYYTANNKLLAEAEGYIGNSAFWGYAHAWDVYDPIVNLWKHGIAGAPEQTAPGPQPPANNECQSAQAARNHVFGSGIVYGTNAQGRQTITLKGVTAQFVGTAGYSVFEIVVWKPADDQVKRIPDTNPTPAKTVWRAKAVIHDGRLTTEGELPRGFFTASTPTKENPEVVYSLESKDIVATLPAGANTDDLEVFVRGDAGDESVVNPPKPTTSTVIPKLNMQSGEKVACPPLNVPLGRSDAGTVPYVRAMLPSLEQRCAMTQPGLLFESVTFASCTPDRTGAGGPYATADILCRK